MVTISPSFSLYRMVVFPAASSPTMRIRISFLPKKLLNRFANVFPMVTKLQGREENEEQPGVSTSARFQLQHSKNTKRKGHKELHKLRSKTNVTSVTEAGITEINSQPHDSEDRNKIPFIINEVSKMQSLNKPYTSTTRVKSNISEVFT